MVGHHVIDNGSNLWNVLYRRWKHYQDMWTIPLPRRGILMDSLSQLETRTRPAVYGISVTYLNPSLSWRVTLEQSGQSATHPMGNTWPWLNQLTLSMSMTSQRVMKQSRKSTSLGRSPEYRSALTQRRSSLEYGTALTVASLSIIGAGTIPILIRFFKREEKYTQGVQGIKESSYSNRWTQQRQTIDVLCKC